MGFKNCTICQKEFFHAGNCVTCSLECRRQNARNQTYKNYSHKDRSARAGKLRKSIYSAPDTKKNELILFYDMLYLSLDDEDLWEKNLDKKIRNTAKYFYLMRELRLIGHGLNKCKKQKIF